MDAAEEEPAGFFQIQCAWHYQPGLEIQFTEWREEESIQAFFERRTSCAGSTASRRCPDTGTTSAAACDRRVARQFRWESKHTPRSIRPGTHGSMMR